MMDIVFFQRQSKFCGGKVQDKWAKIILNAEDWENVNETDSENTFSMLPIDKNDNCLKIGGIPVLETEYANIAYSDENDAIITIENLLTNDNLRPEVILSMELEKIYEVVKATKSEELELKVMTTTKRNLLHYAIWGEDNSVLLISYSDQDDFS